MSADVKAKGLAVLMGPKEDEDEEMGDPLAEAKAAFKEGDGDGFVEAMAAYIDSCMASKE